MPGDSYNFPELLFFLITCNSLVLSQIFKKQEGFVTRTVLTPFFIFAKVNHFKIKVKFFSFHTFRNICNKGGSENYEPANSPIPLNVWLLK
jgi:hypothetical protein